MISQLLWIVSLTFSVHAEPRLRDQISVDVIQSAIERAQQMETPPANCTLPAVKPLPFDRNKTRAIHSIKDQDGNQNRMTVFTEKESDEIQAYIGAQDHLAHDFIEAGCWQRAIETNRLLQAQGFQAGIIQAFGEFRGENEGFKVDSPPAAPDTFWKMHTAAVIAVQVKNKVELRVIDPALSRKILSKEKWLAELKRRSTTDDKIESEMIALDRTLTSTNIQRANQTLQVYREALLKR